MRIKVLLFYNLVLLLLFIGIPHSANSENINNVVNKTNESVLQSNNTDGTANISKKRGVTKTDDIPSVPDGADAAEQKLKTKEVKENEAKAHQETNKIVAENVLLNEEIKNSPVLNGPTTSGNEGRSAINNTVLGPIKPVTNENSTLPTITTHMNNGQNVSSTTIVAATGNLPTSSTTTKATTTTTTTTTTSTTTTPKTTTTTTKPPPTKPHTTKGFADTPESEKESVDKVTSSKFTEPHVSPDRESPNTDLSHRNRDYIVPIVTVMLTVPLAMVVFLMVYRRLRDYWSTRHYRRMDFLLDGMYND